MNSRIPVPGARSISSLLGELLSEVNNKALGPNAGALIGLSTGISDLDNLTSGLRRRSLVVIGGRPAMGKSSLALQIASHVAVVQNLPVIIFTQEMSAGEATARLVSQIAEVDLVRLQNGGLDAEDWRKCQIGIEQFSDSPLYIDETPALTVEMIRSRAHAFKERAGKVELIVIDTLQCLAPLCFGKVSNKDYWGVLSALRELADALDVPVVVLSQLNRKLEKRQDHRPILSDLPFKNASLQADMLLFLYRDVIYNPSVDAQDLAELTVERNRYGISGAVNVRFVRKFCKFENLSRSSR